MKQARSRGGGGASHHQEGIREKKYESRRSTENGPGEDNMVAMSLCRLLCRGPTVGPWEGPGKRKG